MYCKKCGALIPEGNKFCGKCGEEAFEPSYEGPEITEVYYERDEVKEATYEGPEVKVAKETEKKEKSGNKKSVIIIAVAAAVVVILCICIIIGVLGKKNKAAGKPSKDPVKTEKTAKEPSEKPSKKDGAESEKEEVTEEKFDNPLSANSNVEYTGNIKLTSDLPEANTARGLVSRLIEEKKLDADSILSVCAEDFEQNGNVEAIVFEGQFNDDDESMSYYEGTFWYVDDDEIVELEQSESQMWDDCGRRFYFPGRTYLATTAQFTTGYNTRLWSVYNGTLKCEVSDIGYIKEYGDGLVASYGTYDGVYSEGIGLMGHTWKPYYLRFNEWDCVLTDIKTTEISYLSVDYLCGNEVYKNLNELEAYFLSAYERENGLININYITNDTGDICFKNATYDKNKKSFVDEEGYKVSFEDSDLGGFFKKSLIGEEENEKDDKDRTQIVVYTCGNVVPVEDKIILFGELYDSEGKAKLNKLAVVFDNNTNISSITDRNVKAVEYMKSLSDPTEEMFLNGETLMGVWDVSINGSLVEKVEGLYWWD